MAGSPVEEYGNYQYVTGKEQKAGMFLTDEVYAEALDSLVVCCADAAVMHDGLWLLGKRRWLPHPDWWVIGGRMRKGELIEQALGRNLRRELGLDIGQERLRSVIGYYNLIWDTRAQQPTSNGCHLFSIVTLVQLSDEERAGMRFNEEYADSQWIEPWQVIEHARDFHPCLVQIARDIIKANDSSH
jgi:ADP-ribose pyrophosphatase YjhB (NUDIX family)